MPNLQPTEPCCAFKFLGCGDGPVVGTTRGAQNFVGGPSPDAFFVISVFRPTSVVLTTCAPATEIATRLMLYDAVPFKSGSKLLAHTGRPSGWAAGYVANPCVVHLLQSCPVLILACVPHTGYTAALTPPLPPSLPPSFPVDPDTRIISAACSRTAFQRPAHTG